MSDFYTNNAEQLATQYDSLSFAQVHISWEMYWPVGGESVLDIGAGSGRDAKYFGELGCKVTAVEPSEGMFGLGKRATQGYDVIWLQDSLPKLQKLEASKFDLILVSAVWMHLNDKERVRALAKLSQHLNNGGRLVITLRHGEFSDGRNSYPLNSMQLGEQAEEYGLKVGAITANSDELKRADVSWETVVLLR